MFNRIKSFLLPQIGTVPLREKLLSGIAALAGIVMVTWVSHFVAGDHEVVFLAASMGSAAVLLFALPHSPMAQPWPIIGGHIISAIIGVTCYQLLGDGPLSAALATAVAIVAMYLFRCMNPPGGAAALGAVIGGPLIHDLGYSYVLVPIGLNVVIITVVAIIINNILPGRHYPLRYDVKADDDNDEINWALGPELLNNSDIDAAIESFETFIDADRDELRAIFMQATMNAYKRRIGDVKCSEIMTSEPLRVTSNMTIKAVRKIMGQQYRKALPVIDDHRHVVGMITYEEAWQKLPDMTRVAEVLNNDVDLARPDLHIIDIVPVISRQGWRAIPVVDDNNLLLGVISRAEISRALLALQ